MKALILAGGRGKEFLPLTKNRSKVMISLLGKPILEYIIETLKENGITDITIVAGYFEETIREYFKKGEEFGVNITYRSQGESYGIEKAIMVAKDHFIQETEFLMVYGDIISSTSFISRVLNTYDNTAADRVMSLTLSSEKNVFGTVDIKANGQVEKVNVGEQRAVKNRYIVAGSFILTPEVFEQIEEGITFSESFNKAIEQGKTVAGAIISDDWVDIGRPWDLFEATKILFARYKGIHIAEETSIGANVTFEGGPIIIRSGVKIKAGTHISGPVYIGKDCFIGNNSLVRENSVIGEKSLIGMGVEVKNSITLEGAIINRLCYIGDSVIGKEVSVNSGTMTVNVKFPEMKEIVMTVKEEKMPTGLKKLGTVIGDNSIIGSNTTIFPGIKIGNDVNIEPGAHIDRDIPDKSNVKTMVNLVIEGE